MDEDCGTIVGTAKAKPLLWQKYGRVMCEVNQERIAERGYDWYVDHGGYREEQVRPTPLEGTIVILQVREVHPSDVDRKKLRMEQPPWLKRRTFWESVRHRLKWAFRL